MNNNTLILIGVGVAAVYFLTRKPAPVMTTIQQPQVAPSGAYSPMYGFPTNTMQGSAFASGGYSQRSDAQDAAAIITAIGSVAKNVSDIASAWA